MISILPISDQSFSEDMVRPDRCHFNMGLTRIIDAFPTNQQEQIRNSTLHVVQGHGHTLFLTAPVEFREQLESFLAGL